MRRLFLLFILIALLLGGGAYWYWKSSSGTTTTGTTANESGASKPQTRQIPVAVADVVHGRIEETRSFTGSLQAQAELLVSAKIAGRIEALEADLADSVMRDQLLARLDDDELAQALAQAKADLAVAEANQIEAESLLAIAERELDRVRSLQERGVGSASQLDLAQAEQLAKSAQVAVTQAQVRRAESALESARLRLEDTEIRAVWRGGNRQRIVAERLVEEGETVAANQVLFRVVELDPIEGVFFVTERDYGLLAAGQSASLTTDAFPDERFVGAVSRIAPVFIEETRQARVEIEIANQDLRLKPGMFVRATLVLDVLEEATILPLAALTERDGRSGVFVINADATQARWQPVEVLIRDGDRIAVTGESIEGQVVVLGQQQLADGSPVSIETAP